MTKLSQEDKEKKVISSKEKIPTLSGFLTFKEYECNPLYNLSLESSNKNKRWKFIVAFLLRYEGNGKFLPSIQVWEKYKPGVHTRKADLVALNGAVLKGMSKLVWRQLPEWIFELNELLCTRTAQKIRNDFSDVFNAQVEEYRKQKAKDAVDRSEFNFKFYRYSLKDKLKELGLPESLSQDEYKEALYQKIKSNIVVSDSSELGEIQIFKDNFKKYIKQVAREYFEAKGLEFDDFKTFELPFKYPKFLENEDGSSFSGDAHGLGYIKQLSRVLWTSFLDSQSRGIAVSAYPEMLLSVVDRGSDDGDVLLKSVTIGIAE